MRIEPFATMSDGPRIAEHDGMEFRAWTHGGVAHAPTLAEARATLAASLRATADVLDPVAPALVEVTTCSGCPFVWTDGEGGPAWCQHPIPGIARLVGDGISPPPAWCPLRAAPTLVTLRTHGAS